MKLNLLARINLNEGDLIAGFGEANLFKYLNGKFELRGGTAADRAEASRWCSQFMSGAVAACSPAPPPRSH